MGDRAFKDRLYTELATIGKALASPHRLELLDLLAQGERSVDQLATESGLSLANASNHLQVLRQARLVEADKRGLNVVYRLAVPEVAALWRAVRDIGSARLAEVDRLVETFLTDRAGLEPISMQDVRRLVESGAVTLLDVRPELEYRQGHLPGARSMPVGELERRLAELPSDREVVAYCRGPYCVYADEAAQLLRRKGYQVRRLVEGVPEWSAAGLPVEIGAG
jgi:rhodanese-related sulfurtransferase